MKKALIVFLAISVVFSAVLITANALDVARSDGDVNGDGATNSLDSAYILRYDVGLVDLDEAALISADYNCDGEVNSVDAAMILRKDAGLYEIVHVENFLETRIGVCVNAAIEAFYMDDEYVYYNGNMENYLYVITYADGTKENAGKALARGHITFDELAPYGIGYAWKEPRTEDSKVDIGDGVASPDNYVPTLKAALDGSAEVLGTYITEGFVNTEEIETDNLGLIVGELAKNELSREVVKTEVHLPIFEDDDTYVVKCLYKHSMDYALVYFNGKGQTQLILDCYTEGDRYRLVIDGEDMIDFSASYHPRFQSCSEYNPVTGYTYTYNYVELPLFTAFKELGVSYEWVGGDWERDGKAELTINQEKYVLDMSVGSLTDSDGYDYFVLAPGNYRNFRQEFREYIVDCDSVKAILSVMGKNIRIDHEEKAVFIYSE
ncbi:MAG: dockerin type I repeat-containing protein [Clostridia bacterium]|nr:dockerin type I repeat-containing protein [Clostridia bacterium]